MSIFARFFCIFFLFVELREHNIKPEARREGYYVTIKAEKECGTVVHV